MSESRTEVTFSISTPRSGAPEVSLEITREDEGLEITEFYNISPAAARALGTALCRAGAAFN